MEEEKVEVKEVQDQAYIKIIKNPKSYAWEIKAFEKTTIEQLEKIKEKVLQLNSELLGELGE